ncbi:hypothetical protein CL176_11050 [Suicoccus acidiformans]|uniref:Uncharacterized protein n=1 Tax=Suicoccus acidiformans TaxID=2036206 RepID=A0A347WN30_9LACT|nr:hypothetical protein [Suicoccus acidiformans]AXY26487.1 hypothetical protein CL176_11050 [Suicoccus acidiformans]
MIESMQKISPDRATLLAEQYQDDKKQKFIVYNIRRRSYILHSPYRYYFRFTRRQSVWNTPVVNIEDIADGNESTQALAEKITAAVNQHVEDTLSFKLKREFTLEDSRVMLEYYFDGKCYLAYYDYYLGRVCLIKERDKSDDFGTMIGERYYFIDDLHNVIQYKLGLGEDFIHGFIEHLTSNEKVEEFDGFEELNTAVHEYMTEEINSLENQIAEA